MTYPVTCPNCGSHDLSRVVVRKYAHRECRLSEEGTTEWQEEVPADSDPKECRPCPTCGQECTPVEIVCPNCFKPVGDADED